MWSTWSQWTYNPPRGGESGAGKQSDSLPRSCRLRSPARHRPITLGLWQQLWNESFHQFGLFLYSFIHSFITQYFHPWTCEVTNQVMKPMKFLTKFCANNEGTGVYETCIEFPKGSEIEMTNKSIDNYAVENCKHIWVWTEQCTELPKTCQSPSTIISSLPTLSIVFCLYLHQYSPYY